MDRSRYPVRLTRLGVEEARPVLTPQQRIAMVWTLTAQAWAFKESTFRESRLRRDVGRLVRGRR
ncbi:MAG: hypothetical protein ACJ79H_09805 [Myxococcales bacterium]